MNVRAPIVLSACVAAVLTTSGCNKHTVSRDHYLDTAFGEQSTAQTYRIGGMREEQPAESRVTVIRSAENAVLNERVEPIEVDDPEGD